MNKKGFTLIELLIVVAIISILAGIVLVGLRPSLNTARDVRRASELKQLQTALQVYYARYGKYPNDFTELATAVGAQVPAALGDAAVYSYQYTAIGSGSDYRLGVQFEDIVGDTLRSGAATDQNAGSLQCSDPKVYCLRGY